MRKSSGSDTRANQQSCQPARLADSRGIAGNHLCHLAIPLAGPGSRPGTCAFPVFRSDSDLSGSRRAQTSRGESQTPEKNIRMGRRRYGRFGFSFAGQRCIRYSPVVHRELGSDQEIRGSWTRGNALHDPCQPFLAGWKGRGEIICERVGHLLPQASVKQ